MAQVETFQYPSWWVSVNLVRVWCSDGTTMVAPTSAVEFLPQGVAINRTIVPWGTLVRISETSS